MPPEIMKIDPSDPVPAFFRCKQVISSGGVVVYPTDTFYGLGVDPQNAEAVNRLFQVKGRAGNQPILLLLKDAAQVNDWAAEVNAEAEHLMNKYWPGPLTLVFRAKQQVLPLLTGGRGTIGLRVPGNPVTRQLLGMIGTALTGTSANISGEQSLRTAEEAAAAIGDLADLVLDGGPTAGGKPSTVVDVSTHPIRVIREGAVRL
jgi:L-threonylcarbamoyladenylate synthase